MHTVPLFCLEISKPEVNTSAAPFAWPSGH